MVCASKIFSKSLLLFRERKKGRETHTKSDLLFYLFVHSGVESCTCPDRGSNLQHWPIGLML